MCGESNNILVFILHVTMSQFFDKGENSKFEKLKQFESIANV